MSKPKVLILGWARHGKDTVAELMRDQHGFTFQSSSMFAAENVVRPALAAAGIAYDTLDECYADRVNHRAFWYDTIAAYNSPDKTRLAAAILETADIYVGMRSGAEYRAAMSLFDHILWVNASGRGLPPEPSDSMDIAFDPATMIWVSNDGTLTDLERTVANVVTYITKDA